ncbi:MAG: 2-oxoacid:acceptor oxidoreductase family protein [Syntrophothermus sp.]
MQQVKTYGLGGQGVVTASKILATAISIHEGRFATAIPAYGHERRGAPVFADLMADDAPILVRSFVYEPDYVMVFDLSVIDKGVDVTRGARPDTVFVVNSPEAPGVLKGRQVIYADARKVALEAIGRDVPNSAMLGLFAATKVVSIDSISKAIQEAFGAKGGDKNAEAARTCYQRAARARS